MPSAQSPTQTRFINRELSWLEFNQRVLDQALNAELPLLERAKFLAITGSNLDEFFMVRVGGLAAMCRSGLRTKDASGNTPTQQLKMIDERASRMIADQYQLLTTELLPALEKEGLAPEDVRSLQDTRRELLNLYYMENIFPLLTPLAVEDTLAPYIPALKLIIAAELKDLVTQEKRIALIPVPDYVPRRIPIPGSGNDAYILCEDLISASVQSLFPGEKIVSSGIFRVTRNGDVAVQEDDASDLAEEMEEVLVERRFSDCVRLEISAKTPLVLSRKIQHIVQVGTAKTYRLSGPLDHSWLMDLANTPGNDHHKVETWVPQSSPSIDPELSMFENIRNGDILLNNPYESFEPVVRFLEEAAVDPNVIAIKQVLYRTARNSRIVAALMKAAKNGKQVTALVELKARFDEARNLDRAEDLQREGVHVVYGVKGLKTHAKICLIVRREDGHIVRYCHFGTGNYNESTARLYTDISFFTCEPSFGMDASLFFNSVTGRSQITHFSQLVPSPLLMKKRLLELIESEGSRAKQGEPAKIMAKMNSLQDEEIIEALYKASKAGVEIELNVRGICCLKTGTKESKNIRVVSIVDSYLEHARIFYFNQGGTPLLYIASADWMTRNLEKRVELMIPIHQPKLARRLKGILETCLRDTAQSWKIQSDGTSQRILPGNGKTPFRSQEYLAREARRLAKDKEQERLQSFTPLTPQE